MSLRPLYVSGVNATVPKGGLWSRRGEPRTMRLFRTAIVAAIVIAMLPAVARGGGLTPMHLIPADPIKHTNKGLIGALVIEPLGATWAEDAGSRLSATITAGASSFREFVALFQDDINLRSGTGNGIAVCPVDGGPIATGCKALASGNNAINYRTEPMWFRLGFDPGIKVGDTITRNFTDALSNSITGGADPILRTPFRIGEAGSAALAAVGLMRSVDTSNVIAGNMAFKQATIYASDLGVENAYDQLATIVTTTLEANYPAGCTNACTYYPTLRAPDSRGIPTVKEMTAASPSPGAAIDWTSVPSVALPAELSQFEVRYVIDRLCQGPAPVTDIQANCYIESPQGGGSKKSLAVVFSSSATVYYRVTVRVLGPRNTLSYVQAVVNR